ncbi:primase homolog protein-like, partial [Carica papaya]|uniref:primase homolog protein-like n=1 Tax=Carica papaya TaxID=3649 RepID=UPI000B8CD49A
MRFLQQNQQRNFRSIYSMSANISALVSANRLLETHTSLAFIPFTPSSSSSSRQLFHTCKRLLPVFCSKPISNNHPIAIKSNGISYISRGRVLTPVHPDEEDEELVGLHERRLRFLCHRLKEIGIDPANCVPGKERRMICPMCKGGESKEVSLSVSITYDGAEALWNCFRANCGWRGRTKAVANEKSTYSSLSKTNVVKTKRQITEQSLSLEPLCDQVIREYFAVRMISAETLQRNGVMQKKVDNQIAIAFTYRRKKLLVNCKYRDLNKRFWQEKDAEKILYGLDDIEKVDDIIIVEGEIDKLSMEEAGFRNCVSVPDGAPPSVSKKELPAEDKDTKYQYLWNCKEYLKKASRIILATDGDEPGQALAEELARRLGKERCWRVKWPKKNKDGFCKDANEVLMYLGPEVLKEVIQDAEIYPIRGLFRFSDYFDEIDAYYHRTHGYEFGVSTGWNGLNNLYKLSELDEGRIEQLERDFSEEEVWEGLMQCDKDKSSGPDGFNLGFIQKCWHFIKDEIMEIFRELDEKETFVKSLNSTFL